jgi:hypothetical protein
MYIYHKILIDGGPALACLPYMASTQLKHPRVESAPIMKRRKPKSTLIVTWMVI